MNSINRNQNEQNHEDLAGGDAIAKIRDLVEKAGSCFFCTNATSEDSSSARPMTVQKIDDAGSLWFLSANDSHKDQELLDDPFVKLYFQGSAHSDFLVLKGRASVSADRQKIKELWEPVMKTWFTEGIDDPRISVIEVAPSEGYYWDTKHGNAVAGIKMMIGAALGKTMDDSIEGTVKV